jgi:hypothetical protein
MTKIAYLFGFYRHITKLNFEYIPVIILPQSTFQTCTPICFPFYKNSKITLVNMVLVT